jgi:hypothetical protein
MGLRWGARGVRAPGLAPRSRAGCDIRNCALMSRQGKTIWPGTAMACTACKHACTQREMRLWSKGDIYPEKLMGSNEPAPRQLSMGPLKGQDAGAIVGIHSVSVGGHRPSELNSVAVDRGGQCHNSGSTQGRSKPCGRKGNQRPNDCNRLPGSRCCLADRLPRAAAISAGLSRQRLFQLVPSHRRDRVNSSASRQAGATGGCRIQKRIVEVVTVTAGLASPPALVADYGAR